MYVGVDMHKATFSAAVIDEDGSIVREAKLPSDPEQLRNFSYSLPSGSEIVMESSSTWYWAYRILSERHKVVLSNPLKTKAIASAKVKTDRIDSLTLAELLRGGYIPECYIPDVYTQQVRELVRYRAKLVRLRTIVKNSIHAHLLMYNIKVEGYPFTESFKERLKGLGDPKIIGYLKILGVLDNEIHEASETIKGIANDNKDAQLLMSIPGISFYSALLISSEIGDINRFPDAAHLVSYAGLAPSTYSSGNAVYHGSITKQGSPYLRWILTQVTWANIRKDPYGRIAQFYNRLKAKKGSSKAIVAASAKMLRIIYSVLKNGSPYS